MYSDSFYTKPLSPETNEQTKAYTHVVWLWLWLLIEYYETFVLVNDLGVLAYLLTYLLTYLQQSHTYFMFLSLHDLCCLSLIVPVSLQFLLT